MGAADMKERGKKPSEKRAEADRQLDEALEESFPASDPLPTTRTSAGGPEHADDRTGRRGRRSKEDK
jgi:hypothetical protein